MKSRRIGFVGALCILEALGVAVLPGCGGEPTPQAQTPNATQSVARASIFVTSDKDPEAAKLAERLSVALSRAGYEVVASEANDHVLTADVKVALRESHSLLQVSVNGQVRQNFVAQATLRISGGNQVLSGEHIEYDVSDGPSEENMRALIMAVRGQSVQEFVVRLEQGRNNEIARQKKAEQDQANTKAKEAFRQRQEQQHQDDAAWNQVVLSDCTTPTQLTGCDSVKGYIAEYPTGRHMQEAKQALNTGAPIISKLTDERDWGAARADQCKKPTLSTDCDGVTSYIAAQAVGAHVDEARAMLAQAESKLAALRKGEEQRVKDAEAKAERDAAKAEKAELLEEKRQARDQCKKDCIGGPCFAVRPGAYEICLDRCIKANCE